MRASATSLVAASTRQRATAAGQPRRAGACPGRAVPDGAVPLRPTGSPPGRRRGAWRVTQVGQIPRDDAHPVGPGPIDQRDETVDLDYSWSEDDVPLLHWWQGIFDEVDAHARAGDLLVPGISPELARLRGWALSEFAEQPRGAAPRPWHEWVSRRYRWPQKKDWP